MKKVREIGGRGVERIALEEHKSVMVFALFLLQFSALGFEISHKGADQVFIYNKKFWFSMITLWKSIANPCKMRGY